ncbi:SDR family NAD(P)-dependent oxidoreductase [Erythrobacter sp. G21629-S1]|jgi:short-subunit dehydrogenase|nr:SDR family NAD(P)-dependent oxidoreductase [Erythrobacter sp. G21629-S1]
MSFKGKACWITGGSSGVGAALARELSDKGASVIISGRNRDRLTEVAADCGDALVLPFDLRDPDSLKDAAHAAWDWKGGIDLAVANAGVSQRSRALETDMSVFNEVIGVDLLAQIAFAQALIGPMVERGSGSLAFVNSLSGKIGVPLRTAYCAAKFGLAGYADSLRGELSQTGVGVHSVFFGSIQTDIARNALSGDGSIRGTSDAEIENGLLPQAAARGMLDAIAAGEREIIVAAPGMQLELCNARRTPDAIFDKVAETVAAGYMESV